MTENIEKSCTEIMILLGTYSGKIHEAYWKEIT
jgi:hypothetical protein